jgi:hypothetical protein
MRYQLLATLLACTTALASFGANATEVEPYPDAAYNGDYVIEVLPNNVVDHSQPKCMVFDPALGNYGVSTYRWNNNTALCGLGSVAVHAVNKQAVWNITPVKHTDGRKAYVIRSRLNGRCLIRSNNGHDVAASLHMWNATNPALCGWGSQDALIDNGQAAWVLGEPGDEGGNLVTSIGALRHGIAYLSFASTNRGLRAGQTMLAVDHVFRLTRVPENCAHHALQPDIVRVCGVGDFSQPVRVEDSEYLQMRFEPWNATASSTDFYGNWQVYYVAIWPEDAHTYCSRLRTGSFSDWRMPTLVELRAMAAAFSNDELKALGWATGYRGHQTTDTFQDRGHTYFRSVRFFDDSEGREWDENPYPIACIR